MTTHERRARQFGWGITAVVAAAITTGVPTASADMVNFHIAADQGVQTYYVGTNYGISVTIVNVTGTSFVTFSDNGQCIGGSRGYGNAEIGTAPVAAVNWVPSTVGRHVITANDGKTTQTLTVDIQPAPAGSTPATPMLPVGCSQLDRLLNAGSS
ncbi:hypothetical protein ACFYTS_19170 [Nocardia sp. NPDC004151]|uniref:hypothetical protein n=1 Tax=Nocardia sp. NPDC004151 TaxID=3364304 RepID=UPI0036A9F210